MSSVECLKESIFANQRKQQELDREIAEYVSNDNVKEKRSMRQELMELERIVRLPSSSVIQTEDLIHQLMGGKKIAAQITNEIRQIDIAQKNVTESIQQAEQFLNLKHCISGVRTAMQTKNYPKAAEFICKFKKVDSSVMVNSSDKLHIENAEYELKDVIVHSFEEGIRSHNREVVNEFAGLFEMLMENEFVEQGFLMYFDYVSSRLNEKILGISSVEEIDNSASTIIEKLTLLFNAVAAIIQDTNAVSKKYFLTVNGRNRLLLGLHKHCESNAVTLLSGYINSRKLRSKIESKRIVQTQSNSAELKSDADNNELYELNELIQEVALVLQYTQNYERFIEAQIVSGRDSKDNFVVETNNSTSILTEKIQELAGYYSCLENVFMINSTDKAIELDEVFAGTTNDTNANALTSSCIEEIFHVSKNVGLRTLATGHEHSVAAVINLLTNALRNNLGGELRNRLSKLTETFQASVASATTHIQHHLAKLSKQVPININIDSAVDSNNEIGDSDAKNMNVQSPEIIFNNIEACSTYILQLKSLFQHEIPAAFPHTPKHLTDCLTELENVSKEFEQMLADGQKRYCDLLLPKLSTHLAPINRLSYNLKDIDYANNESNDPFAESFVFELNKLLTPLFQHMSENNRASLALFTAEIIVTYIMKATFLQGKQFNQLGAIQFEKDMRHITAYFFSKYENTKPKLSILLQMSLILNVYDLDDVLDIFGRPFKGSKWKLSQLQVKKLLSCRVEFSPEKVEALKLER